MSTLTRRRVDDPHRETWRVFYGGDICIGSIGERTGVPVNADQWKWYCGFYPISHRGIIENGIAPDLSRARAAFASAWARIAPLVTEADLLEYRRQRAWTEWKYWMLECGCRMPTQDPSGRSRCFCGAEIDAAGTERHVYAEHMDLGIRPRG